MNLCMCGAHAGYPHTPSCPYPLYRGSLEMESGWRSEEANLRRKIAAFEAEQHHRAKSIAEGNILAMLGE